MNLLIKFTENDKRLIIALLLVLILIFVLAGYIGMLITRLMKWQGKKVDDMMHDITITNVVSDKKSFRRVAHKKSWRYFFKKSWIPILILVVAIAFFLIFQSFYDFKYEIFNYETTGFDSLLFIWKDTGEKHAFLEVLGLEVTTTINLVHSPEFKLDAIWSYIFVPLLLTGAIWYLVYVQCLISRAIRIYQLSRKVYDKSMDDVNMAKPTPGFGPMTTPEPPKDSK